MIIRHKRFLDVCFEVHQASYEDLWAKGFWLNMGYTKSWYLPIEYDFIDGIIRKDWEQCTTPEVKCLRYGTWVPL